MKIADLALLYLAVGVALAVALYRRAPRPGRAALLGALPAVPLWPLWAPVAWTAHDAPRRAGLSGDLADRIRAALEEGLQSVAGTPLERLLSRESARDILAEVARVAARREELSGLLCRDEFDLAKAERRVLELERQGAPARLLGSARLHLENVRRLHHLAERDARALEELLGLVSALRTQLVLVRLSGSSGEGVGDIVTELWARIEGLSEASDEVSQILPGHANP